MCYVYTLAHGNKYWHILVWNIQVLLCFIVCERSEDEPNDCRPPMKMLWGRRTCDHAQMVPPRNIPDADTDPYTWFKINMDFTPRETVCSMGKWLSGRGQTDADAHHALDWHVTC